MCAPSRLGQNIFNFFSFFVLMVIIWIYFNSLEIKQKKSSVAAAHSFAYISLTRSTLAFHGKWLKWMGCGFCGILLILIYLCYEITDLTLALTILWSKKCFSPPSCLPYRVDDAAASEEKFSHNIFKGNEVTHFAMCA